MNQQDSGETVAAPPNFAGAELESLRADKWLWAARLFKTRALAAKACDAGHVKLDGISIKPSRALRRGDRLEVRTPAASKSIEVARLFERRGPANFAKTMYIDHTPPPPPQELPMVRRDRGTGRPSKQDRRKLQKIRGY